MAKPFLEKNGKTYAIRVSWTLPNKKYTSKYLGGFTTKREAQLAEGDFLMNLKGNPRDMRFFDLCDFVVETKKAEKKAAKTIKEYEQNIAILKTELGNITISQVSAMQMQMIKNKYSDKPGKCDHIIKIASAIFTFAFDKELIDRNPMARITRPAKTIKSIPHYKKAEELTTLLQFVKEKNLKYYSLIYLMASLGLRPSESVAIQEADVDKSNWTILINKVYDTETKKIEKRTKTKKSSAILPFNETIYNEATLYKRTSNIKSDFLACDENGQHLTPKGLYQFLRRIFGKTQKTDNGKTDAISLNNSAYITPYGFRHSFTNINKNRKKDLYTIGSVLRHDTPVTTHEHYYHADDELNRELIDDFSAIILKRKIG